MVANVSVVLPTGNVGWDLTNSSVAELKLDSIGVGAARNREIEFASSTSLKNRNDQWGLMNRQLELLTKRCCPAARDQYLADSG